MAHIVLAVFFCAGFLLFAAVSRLMGHKPPF